MGTKILQSADGKTYVNKNNKVLKLNAANTIKALLDAKKSTYHLFYLTDLTSVDNLISYDDTENVTTMELMFAASSKLVTIPALNTTNVTSMKGMFYGCTALNSIPVLNTNKVIDMQQMFNSCTSLTTIPLLDTSNVTNMGLMFWECAELQSIPILNTAKVTNMQYMFNGCAKLTSIPALNVSNVTSFNYTFEGCSSLEEIHMTGMKVGFSISGSTKFTREALVEILNNLATVTTTKKLTMGTTNLAKLTDEDKAIATNKGWTLA